MSKYRKIDTRIWNDEKFDSLSHDAKLLYFFLITHSNLTPIGAMKMTRSAMAEELRFSTERLREAFSEVFQKALIRYDERVFLLAFPNFLKYNKPQSPNVVKSWEKYLDYLPECPLKNELIQILISHMQKLPKAFTEALPKGFRKTMLNQEQEQEYSSSSSIIKNKPNIIKTTTTTTTDLPEEWKSINTGLISNFGLSELNHIFRKSPVSITAQVVQESINHFSFGLEHNADRYQSIRSHSAVLVKQLIDGQIWIEEGYVSPEERKRQDEQGRAREKLETLKPQKFEAYFSKLKEEQREALVPQYERDEKWYAKRREILQHQYAEQYFDHTVWPKELERGLANLG